jgi:hypothetical protein
MRKRAFFFFNICGNALLEISMMMWDVPKILRQEDKVCIKGLSESLIRLWREISRIRNVEWSSFQQLSEKDAYFRGKLKAIQLSIGLTRFFESMGAGFKTTRILYSVTEKRYTEHF